MSSGLPRLKSFVADLEQVVAFEHPDYMLEQYKTGPRLAAEVLFAIEQAYGDIVGKQVIDLGCGTGILGIGAAILGAGHVLGVDIDPVALDSAAGCAAQLEVGERMSFVRCDILAAPNWASAAGAGGAGGGGALPLRAAACAAASPLPPASSGASARAVRHGVFDTAILNPPFGTRRPGADISFLRAAVEVVGPQGRVYSLHKSSTRAHLVATAAAWGVGCEVVAELRFDIPATYEFHRSDSLDVAVDLLRLVKGEQAPAAIARHSRIPSHSHSALGRGGEAPPGSRPHRGAGKL